VSEAEEKTSEPIGAVACLLWTIAGGLAQMFLLVWIFERL